jgi:hypothetical protein
MKLKILIVIGILALTAVPAIAQIDVGSVTINREYGYYAGNGGEFTIYDYDTSTLTNAAYSDKTRNIPGVLLGSKNLPTPSFQTFCVETDEYISEGGTYQAEISTTAIKGGKNTKLGDDLGFHTAYLYQQFATGSLSGYDYEAGSGRLASADALQNAIWFLEQEIDTPSSDAAAFVQMAVNAVGVGVGVYTPSGNATWGKTLGGVRVLNLFIGAETDHYQSQLYLVPLPGAVLLGFLGLGYAGVKLRKMV